MKHHFVPVFYLKSWCTNTQDKKLQCFKEVPDGQIVSGRISPKGTAREIDLYALEFASEDKIYEIEESIFKKVDTSAAIILENLKNGRLNSLTDRQRLDWARFLISLRYRNPKAIDYWKQIWAEDGQRILLENPEEYDDIRSPNDPSNLLDFANQNDPGFLVDGGIRNLVDWIYESEIVDHISKKIHGISELRMVCYFRREPKI